MTETVQQPRSPFEILGDAGIRRLAAAFYDVMDEAPEFREIRAMHGADLTPMKRKLAMYLVGWMGGPPVYLAVNGTVCLNEPHAPYHIGPRQRDLWLACMDEALTRIDASADLRALLKAPLFHIADTVRNRDESDPKPRDDNIIAVG